MSILFNRITGEGKGGKKGIEDKSGPSQLDLFAFAARQAQESEKARKENPPAQPLVPPPPEPAPTPAPAAPALALPTPLLESRKMQLPPAEEFPLPKSTVAGVEPVRHTVSVFKKGQRAIRTPVPPAPAFNWPAIKWKAAVSRPVLIGVSLLFILVALLALWRSHAERRAMEREAAALEEIRIVETGVVTPDAGAVPPVENIRQEPVVPAAPEIRPIPVVAAPPAPPPAMAPIAGTVIKFKDGLFHVQFNEGVFLQQDRMSPAAQRQMQELAARIKALGNGTLIEVVGHTDDDPVRNSARYKNNYELGLMRAETAARHLQTLAANRTMTFKAVSKGADAPPFPNNNAQNKRRNRTVTIMITPPAPPAP